VLPVLVAILGGVSVGVYWRDKIPDREYTEFFCALIVSGLGYGLVTLIIQSYAKRRPGSGKAALWIAAILLSVIAILGALSQLTFPRSEGSYAIAACLNVIETAFALLVVAWIAFYVCYIWAHFAGMRAVAAVRPVKPTDNSDAGAEIRANAEMHYDRARRTRWTARLLLALPSCAFLIVTLAAWTGIIKVGVPLLPGQEQVEKSKPENSNVKTCSPTIICPPNAYKPEDACKSDCAPIHYTPVIALIASHFLSEAPKDLSSPPYASKWVDDTMNLAGLSFLPVIFGAVLLAIVIAIWGLLPVVWAELSPPQAVHEKDHRSEWLGRWLNNGFRFMHWSGALIYGVMSVVLAALVVGIMLNEDQLKTLQPALELTNKVLGTLVVGVAVSVFGFAGRIKSIALGFRPAVRVMLDVDSWLREHPRDSNPTARICGRYVSLLRHIVAWRDEKNRPYDALVIIAHSQGTVITADLLRFIEVERKNDGNYDPELHGLGSPTFPIYLFTMGCPLHQLYGLRFPYLYGWARGPEKLGGQRTPPDLKPSDAPDPDTLGVKQWVNAFRSGDYVGRQLWRPEKCDYGWNPMMSAADDDWDPPAGKPDQISADLQGKRIEFCIGPGAHTHYWDHTAELIAEVLDRLINAA
jgi:hypothetical protein